MPGSQTPPGRPNACDGASARIALRPTDSVGTRIQVYFAAQWLAYTLPCRRFADILAVACARLGADADRYSFIAVDLHHLLLAGLPAHLLKNSSDSRQDRFAGVTRPLARSRSLILGRSERSVFAAFRAQAREQSFSTESARSRRCWLTAFGPRITLLRAVRSLISNMAAVRSGATSGGKITRCVVPSRQGVFNSTQLASRIALHTRIGQCRADEVATLFQRLTLVGSAAYGGVRAETLHVGAQPKTYTTSWDIDPPSPSPPIE